MKELITKNFRCFDSFEIDFRPGVNLLVGDNSSGKTSLLRACKYALSAFFSGFSDENTTLLSPGKDDFRNVIADGSVLPTKPIEISFTLQTPGVKDFPLQTLKKNSVKNSKPLMSGIKALKEEGRYLLNNLYGSDESRKLPLPLFAAFSTEDIHSTRKISAEKFKTYYPKNSFGYYECLNVNGLLKYWLNRMLVLTEGEKTEELKIVKKGLLAALGPGGCNIILDFKVRPLKKKVFFILTDGREVETELLSDGYKRLVNLVIDLAFRAAILNGNLYGEETLNQTAGTVLIDELDMHLHPSLQGCVLKSLRKAFPRLQIIASTHSPMVMSGVEDNQENGVFKMWYKAEDGKYDYYSPKTYGLDSSLIIEGTFGLPSRDAEVDEELKSLFASIDNEAYAEALSKLESLRSQFGDNLPELERASTTLRLMTGDYEED